METITIIYVDPFIKLSLLITFADTEAPNRLNLVSERPNGAEMNRYRQAERLGAIHRAAAKLWAKGVPMGSAMSIVSEAVSGSTS